MKKTLIIALLAYGCTISPAFAQAEVLFDLASQLLTNLFQNQDQIKQGDGFTDDASLSKRLHQQRMLIRLRQRSREMKCKGLHLGTHFCVSSLLLSNYSAVGVSKFAPSIKRLFATAFQKPPYSFCCAEGSLISSQPYEAEKVARTTVPCFVCFKL